MFTAIPVKNLGLGLVDQGSFLGSHFLSFF